MPEFGFTEEQELFRTEMRRFARKAIAPLAKEMSETSYFDQLKKADEVFNLSAINFPERCGGWELDWLSVGILQEELCMAGTDIGYDPHTMSFCGMDMHKLPEETQDEIAPQLINRTATLMHGYTEGNSGNEQAAVQTTAVRKGDYYIINGEKQPATGCAGATYGVITAVTDPAAGTKGISQFIVPRATPGVSGSLVPFANESLRMGGTQSGPGTPETDPMAMHGCIMSYDDVKVPVRYRLGEEGEGHDYLEYTHKFAALNAVTIKHVCDARLTLQEMIEFTGQRVHFGQPINQFQGVSFKLAEHYVALEAARMLIYRTLWLQDQGLATVSDFAMAKMYGCEVAERALLDFLKIGGYPACSTESPVIQRVIDSIVIGGCADGQTQMLKLRILSDIAPDAIPPNMAGRLVV